MKIRLNSILIIFVLTVLCFFFIADTSGTYLNGLEAQVFLLIGVALASLLINSRFNNEFLEVLNVVFVIFYICRIPFVFMDNVASDVLLRQVDMYNNPWYLIVLAVQYFSLLLCILAINPRIPRENITNFISEPIFKKILLFSSLLMVGNIVKTIFFFSIYGGTLSHIPAILKTIFTVNNIMMLIFVSSLMVEKGLLRKYKYAVGGIFLVALLISLREGSKSGLIQLVLLIYLAMLVVRGPTVFNIRGLFVLGFIGLSTLLLFSIGKVVRAMSVNNQGMDPEVFVYYFHRFFFVLGDWSDQINTFSYRVGYLDFFIQKISDPVYEPYVSFTYYAKALVDKITPGFDVFGVPFASRAIFSAYHGPSGSVLNSELITVFAEGHLLLGFFSFLLYSIILLIAKWAFLSFKASSVASFSLFYTYIVFSFYWWLTGSGLDMWVALTMYQGIFVLCTIGLIHYWNIRERFNTISTKSP